MTSTDRAKAFINSKLKRTALIILPLAAATVQAHAGVIFNPASGLFLASGNASTNVVTEFSARPFTNGITVSGVATYTSNTNLPNGNNDAPCANVCGGLFGEGPASGIFGPDPFPVSFDFILSDSNGLPIAWDIDIEFDAGGQTFAVLRSGTSASGDETKGSQTFTGLNGRAAESWFVFFQASFVGEFAKGDTITLNIPGNTSIDIGDASSAVPEPGTGMLLSIAGGALFGVRAIFRRRRS
jgi:hypothetical protein